MWSMLPPSTRLVSVVNIATGDHEDVVACAATQGMLISMTHAITGDHAGVCGL